MATKVIVFGWLLLLFLAAAEVSSQVVKDAHPSLQTRFIYNSWQVTDSSGKATIKQSGVPVRGYMPLRNNLEMVFSTQLSTNDLQRDSSHSLSGAGDFRVQVNQSLSDDRLLLSAGVNLPTGKSELGYNNDTMIVNMLARDYLGLAMRRFGQGFGFNLMVGTAAMLGDVRGGLGVMYEYTGEYNPYTDIGRYDPGNSASLTVSGLRQLRRSSLYGDAVVTVYGSDRLDGELVYRRSPQVALRLGGRHSWDKYRLDGRIRLVWRGLNREYGNGGVVAEQYRLYGNEFQGSLSWRWYVRPEWYLSPGVNVKLIAANDKDLGYSYLTGVGGTVGRTMGRHVNLQLGGRYYMGQADAGVIDIDGYQIVAGVSVTL
ncbi:MAG: hypothetical protein ABII79_02690 [bacterium]